MYDLYALLKARRGRRLGGFVGDLRLGRGPGGVHVGAQIDERLKLARDLVRRERAPQERGRRPVREVLRRPRDQLLRIGGDLTLRVSLRGHDDFSPFRERPPRSSARTPCPGTRIGVSHPNKRSRRRFSEPRAVDFPIFPRQVIATDGPVIPDGRPGRREAHAGLGRRRRVRWRTRVSVFHDRTIGPRDRRSGLDDGGIGRVDRCSRHHDRRGCRGRSTMLSCMIDAVVIVDQGRCHRRWRPVSWTIEVGVVADGGGRRR